VAVADNNVSVRGDFEPDGVQVHADYLATRDLE
jgi:hypothetical protein